MIEKLKKFFDTEIKPIADRLNSPMFLLSSSNTLEASIFDEPTVYIKVEPDKYIIELQWTEGDGGLWFSTNSPSEFISMWNNYITHALTIPESLPRMNMRWVE